MSLMIDLKNEKGFALVTVSITSIMFIILTSAVHVNAIRESRNVEREVSSLNSYYAAEAGLQAAMAQIGFNSPYLGYVALDADINNDVATYMGQDFNYDIDVEYNYDDKEDWVVVTAESAPNAADIAGGRPIKLEARVFLESDLSKYLMYQDAATTSLGSNLTLGGYPDGTIPTNSDDRMMTYFNNLNFAGSGINIYGDVYADGAVTGHATSISSVHGDFYGKNFLINADGSVNTGITNSANVAVSDTHEDGSDRNGDGEITALDSPDHHLLTDNPSGDQGAKNEPPAIDAEAIEFFKNHNSIPAFGNTPQNRFLKLETTPEGTTRVVEYSDGNFTTPSGASHTLEKNATIYVDGDVYTQGEIAGRVSIVSSGNIHFTNNVTYSGGAKYSSSENSAMFMAKKQIRLIPTNLEVSGILYSEAPATSGSDAGFGISARWKLENGLGAFSTASKTSFKLYGNSITNNGGAYATSAYNSRSFLFDENIQKYRPAGIPIEPVLRVVREVKPA